MRGITKDRLAPAPWLAVPAGLALIFVLIPFLGMFVQVRWTDLGTLLAGEAAQDALWLSLKTTVLSTVISVLLGVPLAHVIAYENTRRNKPTWLGRTLTVLVTLPMVLPPVVAGLALLITFGRRGLVGEYLHMFGIQIGFTTTAVVMAQIFVAMPFLIVSLEGALRTRGNDLEKTARNLGASRTRVFFEITLPLTLPAVASGTALTFARALGEFGATITFAGSLQGETRTLPLEIYVQREIDTDTALALAVVLLAVASIVIAITSLISSFSKSRLEGAQAGRRPEDLDPTSPLQIITELKKLDVKPQKCASQPNAVEIHGGIKERGVFVDAEIKQGCITALVGPNGVGKSTVLEMIAGTLRPDEGAVVNALGEDGASTVVWLEQRAHLFPHMKVVDNVAFGPRVRGVNKEEAYRRALAELEAVGCLHLKDRGPTQLSGGQAQRVAIARALAVDPDLVLLDEPFAAVDSAIAWSLRLVLRNRIRVSEATAVLVTHDLVDAAMMADRLLVLEDGRTAEQGSTDEVLSNPHSDFLINLTGASRVGASADSKVVRSENLRVETISNTRAQFGTARESAHAQSVAAGPGKAGTQGTAAAQNPADGQRCATTPNSANTGAPSLNAEGTVVQTAFMASGETAIVKLDSGDLITIAVNVYNRDALTTGARVRVTEVAPASAPPGPVSGSQ